MSQQPKLRKKKVRGFTYWFTKAGGDTYFGNVHDVPYSEAKKLFNDHAKILAENEATSHSKKPGWKASKPSTTWSRKPAATPKLR